MKSLKHLQIEISDISIEQLLYEFSEEDIHYFFSRFKNKEIHKIIFITKFFNKELENISIYCIQKNFQIWVLFDSTLENNWKQIYRFIQTKEKVVIIFSTQCQKLKTLISSQIQFDPIRDPILFSETNHIAPHSDKKDINRYKTSDVIKINQSQPTQVMPENQTEKTSTSQSIQKLPLKKQDELSFDTKIDNKQNEKVPEIETPEQKHDQETKNTDSLYVPENKQENFKLEIPHKQQKENIQPEETSDSELLIFDKTQTVFRPSKFSIRMKLLSIIVTLMTFSLSIMIFAASFFFKRDIETRIQENNSNIVNIISQKIEDLIHQIYFDADLLIRTLKTDDTLISLQTFENPYIFAIAIARPETNNLIPEKWYIHDNLLQQNGLIIDDFSKVIPIYKEGISISLTGIFNILNISPNFSIPILMLSAPVKHSPGKLMLVFINGKKIVDDFPSQAGNQTFMVNRKGDILSFPEIEFVQSGMNIKDMPIVKMMLESKLDNGLTSFVYKNIKFLGAYKKIPIAGVGIISITEEKKAFEPVYVTQRRNLYILGIVLLIAIIIVYFFAKTISEPIKELAIVTEKVEKEDFSVRVIPKTKDEIGQLAHSFNKMVQGLEERERMKDAFGRFVNKEIAEKAMRGEIKLGGEKKECAVFFSDLRGFTAMSEKMTPEKVVEYLNRYFTLMVDCVEKTHGVVDKFIGDAIMATWGSVTSYGNDTENAINGALLMRKALIQFNEYNRKHNLPIAKFGCGINTGEVISGQIGSEKRLEFTVIGDAVNLASRIEALNKPFATDILISQDAYEKVKDIFQVVKMPAIKVKGKAEPQTIYCVLGRKDDPDCPKNLNELRKITGIDWKPQIQEGQETLEEDKEEKYEILQ